MMKPAMTTCLTLFALSALGVQGQFGESKGSDKTITKVVKLLRKMQENSQSDGAKEKVAFTNFKCFCDKAEAEGADSKKSSETTIEYLESEIETFTGQIGQAEMKISMYEKQISDATRSLDETSTLRDDTDDAYTQHQTEMKEILDTVKSAVGELERIGADQTLALSGDHHQHMAGFDDEARAIRKEEDGKKLKLPYPKKERKYEASEWKDYSQVKLVELHSSLAKAYTRMSDTQRNAVQVFLQAPFTGTYSSQSGQIVGILRDLIRSWSQTMKDDADADMKKMKEYDELMDNYRKEIIKMKKSVDRQKSRSGDAQQAKSIQKKELDAEKSDLEDGETYISALMPKCAAKAKSYAKRKALRAGEEAAIAQAISILSSDESFQAFASTTATSSTSGLDDIKFIQTEGQRGEIPSFLQTKRLRGQAPVSGNQQAAHEAVHEVAKLLKNAAGKTQSKRLPAVVAALQAGNPFKEVLLQIKEMVGVIEEEETVDSSKLKNCQQDQKKNKGDIRDQKADLAEKDSDIAEVTGDINNNRDGTLALIDNVEGQLVSYRDNQAKMTASRTEDNLAYQLNVKNLVQAEAILEKAVKVLRVYYDDLEAKIKKGEAGSMSMVQKSHRPWEEAKGRVDDYDTEYSGGKYEGQSGDGGDAVKLLSFILKEAQDEHALAHETEEEAQVAFEDSMLESKNVENLAEKRLSSLQSALAEQQEKKLDYEEDFKAMTTELNALKDLRDTTDADCKFINDNYDHRKAMRKIEYEALLKVEGFILSTPAFINSKREAQEELYGDCRETCVKDRKHVNCAACLNKVTVVGYCAGHGDMVKGC